MGRLAFMTVVLVVAAIDDPAVLVGAMPDLGSEESSALAAFYLARENAYAAVSASLPLAPRHLRLHYLECFRGDDGGMALLHEVAGDLPGVLHHLLREEVRREGLLDAGAACVLLVGEDSVDGGGVPFAPAHDRQDSPPGQFLGDDAGCQGAWSSSSPAINSTGHSIVRRKSSPTSILNFLTAYGVISLLSKCVDSWFSNPKQLLDRRVILTVTGQSKWNQATINSFLRNEVRQDDTNLENIHTRLPNQEAVKNTGQVPSYFVEQSHPAIIAPETFEMVQARGRQIQRREHFPQQNPSVRT